MTARLLGLVGVAVGECEGKVKLDASVEDTLVSLRVGDSGSVNAVIPRVSLRLLKMMV